MFVRHWTEEDFNYLIGSYPTEDLEIIATNLRRSVRAVLHKANELRLKRKKYYSINHTFFDTWTADSAYILGFIITDGCISRGRVCFCVGVKDICILEYIANLLTPGKSPSIHESYRRETLCVTANLKFGCAHLISRLLELGVTERKTGFEVLPKVPDEFKPDLLRGIFDGDGCVYVSNRKTGQLGFNVTSACASFLESVRHELGFDIGRVRTREDGKTYRWNVYSQKDVRRLADFMYYPGHTFCLERKRERFYAKDSHDMGRHGAGW